MSARTTKKPIKKNGLNVRGVNSKSKRKTYIIVIGLISITIAALIIFNEQVFGYKRRAMIAVNDSNALIFNVDEDVSSGNRIIRYLTDVQLGFKDGTAFNTNNYNEIIDFRTASQSLEVVYINIDAYIRTFGVTYMLDDMTPINHNAYITEKSSMFIGNVSSFVITFDSIEINFDHTLDDGALTLDSIISIVISVRLTIGTNTTSYLFMF